MATTNIPPAPIRDPWGSYTWEEWFRRLQDRATASLTSVSWGGIDFTGSNIISIVNRKHNDLTNIQGGTSAEYYHLTSAQHTDLTDGNSSSLHYHSSDRDSANFTGTEWGKLETLVSQTIDATPSSSSATTTHKVPITLNGNTYYILLSNV